MRIGLHGEGSWALLNMVIVSRRLLQGGLLSESAKGQLTLLLEQWTRCIGQQYLLVRVDNPSRLTEDGERLLRLMESVVNAEMDRQALEADRLNRSPLRALLLPKK
jgi:hypothetical protein